MILLIYRVFIVRHDVSHILMHNRFLNFNGL